MSVVDVLVVLGWALAAVGLACMAVYVVLAYREDERLEQLFAASMGHPPSWKARWFLILAAITFLFCIYSGAESMLGWIPASWGSFDEDHEFTPLKVTIAGIFAFWIGGLLMYVIERGTNYARQNYGLRLRVDELEKQVRESKQQR
jgi:hypothetical protein